MMSITAPEGTTGTVHPPFSGSFTVNGKTSTGQIKVEGGKGEVVIKQQ